MRLKLENARITTAICEHASIVELLLLLLAAIIFVNTIIRAPVANGWSRASALRHRRLLRYCRLCPVRVVYSMASIPFNSDASAAFIYERKRKSACSLSPMKLFELRESRNKCVVKFSGRYLYLGENGTFSECERPISQ